MRRKRATERARRRKTSGGAGGEDSGNRIRESTVRLIDEDGVVLGIVSTAEALRLAKEKGLDLFIIQPDTNPPVAKIMDYGRFKFSQEKKVQEVKRKHHFVDIKEIKMHYEIADHDYQVKLRHSQKLLKEGDKIKVLITLRGRETQHKDLAMALMHKFANELKEVGTIESEPKTEGKSLLMVLSPAKK